MKLFLILASIVAVINAAHIRTRPLKSLRRTKPDYGRYQMSHRAAGNLKRKVRSTNSSTFSFYDDPFFPFLVKYAETKIGEAARTDTGIEQFVSTMTDGDWYYFYSQLADQVAQWVNGNARVIETMSDEEFLALSQSFKF